MKAGVCMRAGVAALALGMSASGVGAGQIDAGAYVLTYADAMGAPVVSTLGDSTTYTFPVFEVGDHADDPHFWAATYFAGPVDIAAAPGYRIAARPDVTFPVHGELQIVSAADLLTIDTRSMTIAKSAYLTYHEYWSLSTEYADRSEYYEQSGAVLPNSFTDGARVTFVATANAFELERWSGGWFTGTVRPVVYVDSRYVTTAVPEPATPVLLLAGLGVFLGVRRLPAWARRS